jgi:hypothetical protein
MDAPAWHRFFVAAADVLGPGNRLARFSESWCAWTTFDRLNLDAGYWTGGIPARADVFETHIGDSGVWGQPFLFEQIAHVIVPREFYWETERGAQYQNGWRTQALDALSEKLRQLEVPHRATQLVLEVKCY